MLLFQSHTFCEHLLDHPLCSRPYTVHWGTRENEMGCLTISAYSRAWHRAHTSLTMSVLYMGKILQWLWLDLRIKP
jgi:hypothetical protein